MNHASLLLVPPRHGWLPVRLELDDFIIDHAASGVLNDPVDALIEMFRFTVAPAPVGPRVCFWLEPDGYAIDVLGASDAGRSVLRVFYDEDFVPPMQRREMTVRFECELQTAKLSSALLAGLAGLLEGAGADALDRWRRDESLSSYRDRFNSLRILCPPPGVG